MAVSKAQQRAVTKYDAKAYDKTLLRLSKGKLDVVRAHAAARGESVNGFIGRAISEAMERDSGGMASSGPQEAAGATAGAGVVFLPSETLRTVQAGTGAGKRPAPIDKAKAFEELLRIFDDVGTVDLDKSRCERLGIVYLPPDTLEEAQRAADAAGEAVADFMRRAVAAQAQRDQASLKLGVNPATGGKLEKEA